MLNEETKARQQEIMQGPVGEVIRWMESAGAEPSIGDDGSIVCSLGEAWDERGAPASLDGISALLRNEWEYLGTEEWNDYDGIGKPFMGEYVDWHSFDRQMVLFEIHGRDSRDEYLWMWLKAYVDAASFRRARWVAKREIFKSDARNARERSEQDASYWAWHGPTLEELRDGGRFAEESSSNNSARQSSLMVRVGLYNAAMWAVLSELLRDFSGAAGRCICIRQSESKSCSDAIEVWHRADGSSDEFSANWLLIQSSSEGSTVCDGSELDRFERARNQRNLQSLLSEDSSFFDGVNAEPAYVEEKTEVEQRVDVCSSGLAAEAELPEVMASIRRMVKWPTEREEGSPRSFVARLIAELLRRGAFDWLRCEPARDEDGLVAEWLSEIPGGDGYWDCQTMEAELDFQHRFWLLRKMVPDSEEEAPRTTSSRRPPISRWLPSG